MNPPYKLNKPLPDKPSELIKAAIEDLNVVEKLEGYEIDMSYWHIGALDELSTCRVCLAGSVIAQRSNITKKMYVFPEDFDKETEKKLRSLDCFRLGNVITGLYELEILTRVEYRDVIYEETDISYLNRRVTPYKDSPEQFKKEMLALASDLEEIGL